MSALLDELVATGVTRDDALRIEAHAKGDAAKARAWAAQRASGKLLAYVLGSQPFMGLELEVAEGALVPRAETELLGRAALEVLRARDNPTFIDMCCGSGNLVCGLAHALPTARAWASDLTDGTVALARRNVERVGLAARVTVGQGDLFAGLSGVAPVDAVVCNPPYISTAKLAKDRAELLDQEPREAFDGGPYGLTIHQRVLREALPFVKSDGWLFFEMGLGQEKQLKLLFARVKEWAEVRFAYDADNAPRVAYSQRRKEP